VEALQNARLSISNQGDQDGVGSGYSDSVGRMKCSRS
jgi:hypothetical protein